jgi:hypothetical protein
MYKLRLLCLIGNLFIGVAEAAPADKVPTYDVAASCRAAAAVPDLPHEKSKADDIKHCLDLENQARAELVKQWTEFTPAARTVCLGVSSSGSVPPVYSELMACLDRMRPRRRDR